VTLLALLFALVVERGITHLLHLREWRWFDAWFDAADRRLGSRTGLPALAVAVGLIAIPVVPVVLLDAWIGPQWLHLPQFAFAVLVLLLSFGPRDLAEEVEDYAAALERHDRDEALRRGKELLESNPTALGASAREAIEEAIFIQANNRTFGVIFWFIVLGPVGAWAFRVSDMLRRRAAFEAARQGVPRMKRDLGRTLAALHGLVAWIPARLAALGYALAGSFEDAVGNWKLAVDRAATGLLDRAEDLLARVGKGSLQPSLAGVPADRLDVATARGALRIVARSLWIWLAVIALLVLLGVVDAAHGQGTAPQAPRLLSLAPGLTEIAFEAGAGPLLVGTVAYSDYPAAARALPQVGDAWRVDLERVVALRPDVVLAWPTGTPATTIAQLRRLGLDVVEVPTQRLADVPVALRQVGRIAGTDATAARAAEQFASQVARQRAKYASRPPLSVFIQIDDDPLYTVNGQHVISEIVELCGGRNVFGRLPQLAPPVSAEAVLAADPQVILSTDDTIADVREPWQRWPRLRAVRDGTIYRLPPDLVARASPRLAQGVDATCAVLDEARRAVRTP
jgi:iron complex transport system substrate-binding protein